jgi:hypothetical protein
VILAAHWSDPFRGKDEPYTTGNQDPTKITPEQNRTNFEDGLREMVRCLSKGGRQVYIVQDNPGLSFEPRRQLMTRTIAARRVVASFIARPTIKRMASDFAQIYSDPAEQYTRRFIADLASEYPNVHLIDLRDGLCSGSDCRFAEDDLSLYWDREHLTDFGAEIALRGFQIPR